MEVAPMDKSAYQQHRFETNWLRGVESNNRPLAYETTASRDPRNLNISHLH